MINKKFKTQFFEVYILSLLILGYRIEIFIYNYITINLFMLFTSFAWRS